MNKKRAITAIVFVGICAAGIGAIFLLHFVGHRSGILDAELQLFVQSPPHSPLDGTLDGIVTWAAEAVLGSLIIITGAGILAILLAGIHALGQDIWAAAGKISNRIRL